MILQQLILSVLIVGLVSCQSGKNKIVISGTIKGENPGKIEYTNPINGTCNWWFTKSIEPDSLGNFKINIKSDIPLFLKLRTTYKKQGTIIVEPGKQYKLIFDTSKEKNVLSVTDESSVIQEAYGKFPNPFHIQDGAREFLRDSLASRIKNTIEQRKTREIAEIEKHFSQNTISEDVFNLIKTDRECYYDAVLATTAWIKKMMEMQGRKNSFNPDFEQLWYDAFRPALFKKPEIINTQWFNFYTECYIYFQEYKNGNFTKNKLEELRNLDNTITYRVEKSKEYLPAEFCENYLAHYLYEKCFQKKYEKELIGLFNDFKTNYPESEYNFYISPLIDEIVKFHKTADLDFHENIHFVDEYENINTLSELAGTFTEGKIYVDVWATWCGPCKAEFEHKEELKRMLNKYNIPVLYISIDREKNSERWKNMIKHYELEGYHVRANKELAEELRKIFDKNGSLSIPWYILIDAEGTILNKRASRPSNLSALEKEINEK
ncbi:TlpA family protein disulfide reductase [Saccharicrinis sp. 156]|uniref:TlpA family protein disulfide reductase n=1 Tax=Saccharicrinis sp. 156 TaxID=3417574 RepID=UPI003D3596B0